MIHEFTPIPEGFFGESGLTATSANHVANLLKMRYETIENELARINFVQEELSIVGTNESNTMRSAYLIDDVTIRGHLEEISRAKGFIGFLREAIKCKNALAMEIEDYESERPGAPVLPQPERPLTQEEVVSRMDIGERVRYLSTEARAATFGKYIHPGGVMDKARDRAFEAEREPVKVAMAGRDTAFVKRTAVVASPAIDRMVSSLQAEHRKSEAELNGYKHAIEEAVKKDAQEKIDAYRAAKERYDRELEAWRKAVDALSIADQQARIDRRKAVEGLKIVIPNEYRDLYNAVTNG